LEVTGVEKIGDGVAMQERWSGARTTFLQQWLEMLVMVNTLVEVLEVARG